MAARVGIGDFSRMTHLSVAALRHYHELGLLNPAEIDPGSGYRFYAPEQVQTAQVIRRFRADNRRGVGLGVRRHPRRGP